MPKFFYQKKNDRTFKVPPQPLPKREPQDGPMDPQEDCAFLTKLPAEIRNEIYHLVFISIADLHFENLETPKESTPKPSLQEPEGNERLQEQNSKKQIPSPREVVTNPSTVAIPSPAHPLTLLLTCRRINAEATILAFQTHTFTTRQKHYTTFFTLKQSTAHLSTTQFAAISSLAFDLGKDFEIFGSRQASDFMTNSLLLFPGIKTLDIRVERRRVYPDSVHTSLTYPMGSTYDPSPTLYNNSALHNSNKNKNNANEEPREPWVSKTIREYVPKWFAITLDDILAGRSYSWQSFEKWSISYPQLSSPAMLIHQDYDTETESYQLRGTMSADYAGVVPGVDTCACGCGEASWTLAHLHQDGGREVVVRIIWYGNSEAERERKGLIVRLEPGAEPLGVCGVRSSGGHETGFQWNASDTYRRRGKRRNGGWFGGTILTRWFG